MSNFGIKAWAEDDRPREKLANKGRTALSNAELLAIIIGSGTREISAVELSRQILEQSDNQLTQLAKQNRHELMLFKGIGEAKAISILAAMELCRRMPSEKKKTATYLNSSQEAYLWLKPVYSDLHHEEFHVLMLNRANAVISCELVSSGGFNGTLVDGKVLFKKALDCKASGIILSHNHPSGNVKPSEQDVQLTKKIITFGKLIDLPILDHLIVTDNNYFSFADNGIL